VGTFRQCSQLQRDKDLTQFVAVVVLDEVGLAEDSPSMPLKVYTCYVCLTLPILPYTTLPYSTLPVRLLLFGPIPCFKP